MNASILFEGERVLSVVPPRLGWFNQKPCRCCDRVLRPASLDSGTILRWYPLPW